MKEPTTNILVPRLLDKTSVYANYLKNRIKLIEFSVDSMTVLMLILRNL